MNKLFATAFLALAFFAFTAGPAAAQDPTALPELPKPIKNLVDEGAQIRYLGREHGFDSWLTIKGGQEQYFYVLPDRSAFLMGVLFDSEGKLITVNQVQKLRSQGDTLLDSLANDVPAASKTGEEEFQFKSPSEQLYHDIESSNWVPLGQAGAPVLYAFIDPQCPHCHSFINDLRHQYLDAGQLQLRMVPVGFKEDTRAQAAYLIATPDPQKQWYKHMDGDKTALPAKAEISQQGVQRNLAIMQAWQFNVTPMLVYRAKDGTVKIVQGRPKNLPGMIADIGARG